MDNLKNETIEWNDQKSLKVFIKASDLKGENLEKNMNNHVALKILRPTSIIKVTPGTVPKTTLPPNSSAKTVVINCANDQQSKTLPSTSMSNATADHEYVYKEEPEGSVNIIYLNESEDVTEGDINKVLREDSETDGPKSNYLKRRIEDDVLSIPEKMSKVHSENCCCACRDTLEEILQNQEEILNYLKSGSIPYREAKFDLLPSMPFNDLNDFLDFDESLTNENVLDQLITKLQKLLVSVEKKSVSNIMTSIMTNELCKQISWIGIKDTTAFQNTNMVNHIIDIIQDHHAIDVDIIKGFIAEWLRRCSDRIASEIRKNKKKAQHYGLDDT